MELDEEVVPARQIEARVQHGLVGGAGKSGETGLRLRTNQFRQPGGAGPVDQLKLVAARGNERRLEGFKNRSNVFGGKLPAVKRNDAHDADLVVGNGLQEDRRPGMDAVSDQTKQIGQRLLRFPLAFCSISTARDQSLVITPSSIRSNASIAAGAPRIVTCRSLFKVLLRLGMA